MITNLYTYIYIHTHTLGVLVIGCSASGFRCKVVVYDSGFRVGVCPNRCATTDLRSIWGPLDGRFSGILD